MLAANLSITSVASVCGALDRPQLFLDFRTDTLDPRITFTRADATTCATRFNSAGLLETLAANVARFDYDPSAPAGTVGPELVVNGDFSNGATGWALSAVDAAGGAVVSNGAVTITTNDGTYKSATQVFTATAGKAYLFTATCTAFSGASPAFTLSLAGGSGSGAASVNSTGTFSALVYPNTATPTAEIKRAGGGNIGTATFDNISVREVTFTPRGLLIEESRTNLLLHSRDMTQAAWSKTDVTAARTQVGIDGSANSACLMTEGSAGNSSLSQTATVAAGATASGSMVLRRGNNDWFRVLVWDNTADGYNTWVNLATGAVSNSTVLGVGTGSVTFSNLGGGWYRIAVTATPNGTYTGAKFEIRSAASAGSATRVNNATYIVDCAQLEVGAFATPSVITTGAATATRAVDVNSSTAVMVGATGTVVIEAIAPPLIGTRVLYSFDDGTSSNQIVIYLNTGGVITCLWKVGGVAQAAINTATVTAGTTFKLAFAWALNDFAVSLNGATVLTDTLGTVPTVTTRRIGMEVGNNNQWNSQIRALREYSTRLPNATLQALTA